MSRGRPEHRARAQRVAEWYVERAAHLRHQDSVRAQATHSVLFPPTRTGLVGPGSRATPLAPTAQSPGRREATGGQGVELQMAPAV